MEARNKLFMVMLGCKPANRLTEQHDIFFGVGKSIKDLVTDMKKFWPEANGKIHIDAWREVTVVDNFNISITTENDNLTNDNHLYFINLGGYKENEFEEYHYKILTVSKDLPSAIKTAKQTNFYKHCGFQNAVPHIDDKYSLDVDDMYAVNDILKISSSQNFNIKISNAINLKEDLLHIGYIPISKL